MRIKGAKVYQPTGEFKEQELNIEGDRIVEHAEGAQEELEAFGFYAVPAAINIRYVPEASAHLSQNENYNIDKIAKSQLDNGICAFALSCRLPKEHAQKVARIVNNWNKEDAARHTECADIAGLVLDKPLQHIAYAQPSKASWKDLAREDAEEFTSLEQDTRDTFKLVTVNPNKEGVDEYIKLVKGKANVALADVEPPFAQAEKAIKAGASIVTRSWKKNFEPSEKKNSVVDALYQNEHLRLELVASEKTASKDEVLGALAAFQGRVLLTSWDNNVFGAARRAFEMGAPANVVIDAVTIRAAEALGIERDYGSLETGKLANVVLLDKYANIKHVVHNGKLVV